MKMIHLILLLIISLLNTYILAISYNLSTDGLALLAIKSRIIPDPNNALLNNWTRETSSFCNWRGVSCDTGHSRVTSLRLISTGLTGTIAGEISNLTFLNFLDISNNSFHGEIPGEIGFLRRLNHLALQYNNLEGRIPLNLGSLERLQLLDLSNNQLTGTIPFSIFNVSSMRVLDLNHNQLSGTLPKDICHGMPLVRSLFIASNQLGGKIPSLQKCTQAVYIALSLNQFTGSVPREIGNLTTIQELYLGSNNLTGSLPQDVGNAFSLRKLNLRRNGLVGTIPPSLGNLSNLEMLDMGHNNFGGNIPVELGHLPNLQELYLSFDNLNGQIPMSIFNISKLQVLNLVGNNLSGILPSDIALRLPNIQVLLFGFNQFTGSIPVSISNATKLSSLSFGYNFFTGNIPMTLGNLRELQSINVEQNQLTNDPANAELEFLTSLNNCPRLNNIQIGYNLLNGVLPKSIGNLSSSLEKFHASGSGLQGEIPLEIGNLSNLLWLSLSENNLSGKIPSTVGNLRNLQRLRIFNNGIQGGIPIEFCSLQNLYEADLRNNKLSGEVPSCLGHISSLRQLYLDSNQLTSFIPTTLWNIKGLLIVSLSFNFLNGTLSPEIGSVTGLIELYLAGNNFHGEIPASIGNLQNLVNLSFSMNQFNGQIPEIFGELVSLEYLDLSQNYISGTIPKSLEKLIHLSYLNLSFNNLSGEIPSEGPFSNFTAESFLGNNGLCGSPQFHITACRRSTIDSRMTRTNRVLLRYVLPSCASMVLVVILLMAFVLRYRYKNKKSHTENDFELMHRIAYSEILSATSNFDEANVIGRGSSGSVYKATFSNGMVAAVKKFDLDIQGTLKSFDIECEVMRNTRHRNLVKVISACSNIDLKAIVMEFMPKGTLENWLYSQNSFLDIVQRLRVMIDVANVLEYLHHGYSIPIVHCDVKPNNILFDDDMVAHLGDFGIAKLLGRDISAVQTKTLGTMGYMAPEYGSEGVVSTMVDVYSYGILIMEIVTRKKPTDDDFAGSFTMKKWVSESLADDKIMEIVDHNLLAMINTKNYAAYTSCFMSMIKVAVECTEDSPENRTSMSSSLASLGRIQAAFLLDVETIGRQNIATSS